MTSDDLTWIDSITSVPPYWWCTKWKQTDSLMTLLGPSLLQLHAKVETWYKNLQNWPKFIQNVPKSPKKKSKVFLFFPHRWFYDSLNESKLILWWLCWAHLSYRCTQKFKHDNECRTFWLICLIFGQFWDFDAILGHFANFWPDLKIFWGFVLLLIVGHFFNFWAILAICLGNFGTFCKFDEPQNISKIAQKFAKCAKIAPNSLNCPKNLQNCSKMWKNQPTIF